MRITFLTFLRVAANWSFIAMAQRTNSTAPASGSLGLEPRLPPARDHAEAQLTAYRLSAWELACQASATIVAHCPLYRGSLMFGLLQLGLHRLHYKLDGNFLGLPVAVRQQVNMEYDWPFSLTAKQRLKR